MQDGDQGEADVGPLAKADTAHVAEVLARAFRDNALNRAVIASDDPTRRLNSNRYGMLGLLPVAREIGTVLVAKTDGMLSGALVSTPPNRFPLPPPGWQSQIRTLIGQGWQVARRWGEVFDALQCLHPMEPHWYLGTLGVAPSRQRSGVGTALLTAWLAQVDSSGLPAYLETDSELNLAFYQRAGFQVAIETQILGVPVWCMQRRAPTEPQQY